ncbi:class I adenylate-forming enzyme family protein [uncultured Tateyamaria sp.]|uniref:class I adenylate-forming enzyme family protein n=1 Tax=uncultured Tateyamaria sp. TaxID=455651 RepID=UPI002624DBEA|nr:class I adenylate-forming enzyme family protein [uncultured Tateyamaria sp.]
MLSVDHTTPFPPCPSPFNMAAHVLRRAEALSNKVAVAVVSDSHVERMTYGELLAAVRGTGAGYLQAGCVPGERILLRLGNTIDFPIAYLGALAVGLVPIPTSAALTTTEVARIVSEMRPRVILRDPAVASASGAPEVGLATLRAMRALPPAPFEMGDPDRLGYVVYTSGTSGAPRAVAHAHRAIWARQMMHQGWYGLGEDDVLMHAGAFNWTYTLGTGLMDPWTLGATALIPAAGTQAGDLGALMAWHRTTIFAAAPGVYRQMMAHTELPALPALRHGLSAGEKLPPTTRAAWMTATGTPVHEAYGLSECSTFISACPDAPCDPAALGRAQPGRHIAILGTDGPVARTEPGVIAIHRDDPGLMLGYLSHPEETLAKYQGEWFVTGDMGVMQADGQVHYLGRNDDMMNAGGYRVSPIEVESVMMAAPGIVAAGAAEVEVKPGARVIVVFYTSAAPLDEDALRTYVEANLARYKQPRAYIRLPQMPTGANGKILRRRLHLFWPKNTKAH